MLFHWMGWLLSGLALCGAGYALVISRLVASFREADATETVAEPVTILKPLHFDEPGLAAALSSFLTQDYAAPIQFVFGVQDGADPAIKIVRALKDDYPNTDIELVIDTELHGSNRKVSNLINMSRFTKHGIIVLSDSDISVAPNWLSKVVNALSVDGVGAVSCLYTGRPNGSFWSTLSAMGSSYEFLPNVIAGVSFGLASPCFGSTIALRRSTLDEIGGFHAFANQLADDYEIGRAVREKGLKVSIPAFSVDHGSSERDWTELYRHEVRWNRTTRVIDPLGHTGSFVTQAMPIALLGAMVNEFSLASIGIFATTFASRLVLKWCIERKFATCAGPDWALPIRDAVSFFVFIASMFGEDVHWRGSRFAVSPRGVLLQ